MDSNPWSQRDDEPGKAYAAFLAYLKLGVNRTLKEVAKEQDISTSTLNEWNKDYAWTFRVDQWDAHALALRARAVEEREERDAQKEAKIINNMILMAYTQSQRLWRRMKKMAPHEQGYTMGMDAFKDLASETIRLVRLTHGQPTERNEVVMKDSRKSLIDAIEKVERAAAMTIPKRTTLGKSRPVVDGAAVEPDADQQTEGQGSES